MAATLVVTLRDVTLHDAGHYFLTVQYMTRDGEERKVRTEVSTKSSKPEFKNSTFSLPVRVHDGVLDDAELQFGAFLVVRSEREVKEGEGKAATKGTAKLAGLCAKQLSDLASVLARGATAESVIFTHPDGAAVGSVVADLRIEMPPGVTPLRASSEQLEGPSFELVVRNGVNLGLVTAGLTGGGGGGFVVTVGTFCKGFRSDELARTQPTLVGAMASWNETLIVRPRGSFVDANDGLILSLRQAGGGSGGELAKLHLPLSALRDESGRDLKLELAEAAGAAMHVSVRRLPPAEPTHAQLELETRQLRPSGAGLTLPPAGAVTVALYFKSLADYAPASLPWRHAYVPPAPAAAEVLTRMTGAPPALVEARTVTWAREGGTWPQSTRWTLDGAASAPVAGSGIVVEIYSPEWMPAEGGSPGGDACEWRLWAHATLPMPQSIVGSNRTASNGNILAVPFEAPLVLAPAAASLPGASPPPVIAGSIRFLPSPAPAPSPNLPAFPPGNNNTNFNNLSSTLPGGYSGGGALVGAPHAQLLIELDQKQALVNRLLSEVDARTSALARVGHELVQLRDAHAVLGADHQRAKAELAEKARVLDRLALDAGQAEHLDPLELARRHRMLGGAYRAEKARSDELSRQFSDLSERVGQARRLESAYVSLQDAHRAQSTELQRAQTEAASLPKYRQAVKSQEKLIAKLEGLVKPAMRDAKAFRESDKKNDALRSRLQELEGMHAEAAGIGTEEQVKLVMRTEQAERRATATEAEMAENARKYAREIAALKVRLAEKEAESLGGFSPGSFNSQKAQSDPYSRDAYAYGGREPSPPLPAMLNGGPRLEALRRGSGNKLESLVPRTPPSLPAVGGAGPLGAAYNY